MELVLPNNYVEIEEEEMMYLDGGRWICYYTSEPIYAVTFDAILLAGAYAVLGSFLGKLGGAGLTIASAGDYFNGASYRKRKNYYDDQNRTHIRSQDVYYNKWHKVVKVYG